MKNLYFTADIKSDTGPLKSSNKDAGIIISGYSVYGCMIMAVVCDGLECIINGENASRYVVRRFTDWFENNLMNESLTSLDLKNYVREAIESILQECNHFLYMQRKIHKFMGTMTEVFFAYGGWYCTYGVGDCRAIIIKKQGSTMKSIKEDMIINKGHIVKHYLGQNFDCVPHRVHGYLKSGDSVLVCNYGFWRLMSERYICMLLKKNIKLAKKNYKHMSADTILYYLINRLRADGEGDNISVALIFCSDKSGGL